MEQSARYTIAAGTHAFGLADASTVVEFGARNPEVAPKLLMTVFDRFPAVVLSLKRKPIKRLQDQEEKTKNPAIVRERANTCEQRFCRRCRTHHTA